MTDPSDTTATSRGQRLAADLDAVNDRVAAAVSGCTEEQWRRPTAEEGWPVAVVAHHIAEVQRFFGGALAGIAAGDGEPVALTAAFVEENNTRHARDHAAVGKDETLALLRAAGGDASRSLRDLDDDRLDAVLVVFDGNGVTVAQAVEGALVGHFEQHLASIRATMTA